jgi:hypothetical protein
MDKKMIDKNISQQLSLTLDAVEIKKFSQRKKIFLSGRLLCEKNLIRSLSFALPGGKISSAIIREDSDLQIFSASLTLEKKFDPQKLALYVLFELANSQSIASILVVNEIINNSDSAESIEIEDNNQKFAKAILKNSVPLNHNLSDISDLAVVFSSKLTKQDLLKSLTVFEKIKEPVKSLIIVVDCLDQELLDYFANNPQLAVYYQKEDNISVAKDIGASRVLLVSQALEHSQILKVEELIRDFKGSYSDKSLTLRRLSNIEVETQNPPLRTDDFTEKKQGAIYV